MRPHSAVGDRSVRHVADLLDLQRRRFQAADAAGGNHLDSIRSASLCGHSQLGLCLQDDLVDHESAGARVRSSAEESYAAAYSEYQRRLIAANALDFDDLIMTTCTHAGLSDLREQYLRRFRHVLVDEYQDTNHAQYALIRELCSVEVEGARGQSGPVRTFPPPS